MKMLLDITWLRYLVAALAGYLIGSFSFPRMWHRILSQREKPEDDGPGLEEPAVPPIYSATSVGAVYGKKYGCAASLADMIKVAAPTLAFRLLFPGEYVYLAAALFAIIGNNYPVYYKFKGGAGYSAVLGAVLVINWFGVLIANGAAMILGYLLGSIMVMRISGIILYIAWFAIYFRDPFHIGFMVLANVVFWSSVTRLLMRIPEMKKSGEEEINQEYFSKQLLMGGRFGRFVDEYGLPALLKKLFRKKPSKE